MKRVIVCLLLVVSIIGVSFAQEKCELISTVPITLVNPFSRDSGSMLIYRVTDGQNTCYIADSIRGNNLAISCVPYISTYNVEQPRKVETDETSN